VVDGDTFGVFNVGVTAEERVRLLGVDAAEIRDTLGPAAKGLTAEWLARGPFELHTCKRDSFGRLLAVVHRGTDTLAVRLVEAGLGTVVK
jgi:endonuclease YncB( thermonuclease family)